MNGVYNIMLRAGKWAISVEDGVEDGKIIHKKVPLSPDSTYHYHLLVNSKENFAGLCRSIFTLFDAGGSIVRNLPLQKSALRFALMAIENVAKSRTF